MGNIFKRKDEIRVLLSQQVEQIRLIFILKFGSLCSRKSSRGRHESKVQEEKTLVTAKHSKLEA
jgi:hypothetical protein